MKKPVTFFSLFSILLIQAAAQNWIQTGPVNFPVNVSGQINGIGRVTQIKFHPTQPGRLYVTSASGGLFRSVDNGESWTLMNTDQFPATACASVCIDYTNDDILYLSTGDPNYYGTGFGIYKTTNGGALWSPANTGMGNRMALEMLMDPADHNTVIAATNDGIWRTTNGGASWINVKSGGAFLDMKRRPNSNTLYAVTASQFWTSNDFGVTWVQVTAGLSVPSGTNGMRLGVSAANNSVVYLIANGNNGVLFKSTNSGNSFTQVYSSSSQCLVCYNSSPSSPGQGNYNLGMCADPFDASHIYVVAHCLWESNDGGTSFQQKTEWYAILHTDHHQVEVNPYNANELWNVNDGGVWKRRGTNDSLWDPKSDGIGATEIYQAGQSPVNSKIISIGTQDNGEIYYDGTWKTNRGGDWGSRDPFDYSAESTVYYLGSGERRSFVPYSASRSYNSPFAPTNNSRIGFHPNQPDLAILARDTVFLTRNLSSEALVWTNIYVTTNAIRDLCISSADSSIAYIASNNNAFVRISNLLGTPVVTVLSAPSSTSSRASVAAVKGNVNVVYLSCNSRMYRSANQGASWTDITYNLPGTNILRIYHDDFSTDETVYVCTGNKVYTRNNVATSWTDITFNLPSIANITDFMIFNTGNVASKLRVSYYGRGVWEYAMHPNFPPLAAFTSDKTYVCPGQSVQFTSQSEGTSLAYQWNFPGGTPSSSVLQNPLVAYNTPGIYNVSLTVTNSNGSGVNTLSGYLNVGNGTQQAVAEGFQGSVYPPAGWSMLDAGNDGLNWYRNGQAGGYGTSTRSIAFDNYNNDTQGAKDQIRMPVLDLTAFSSARLTFDVAYAPYDLNSYLDSLRIGVSTDCGATFVYPYTRFGASLATAPVNTNTTFVPLPGQWRTDTVLLNNYLNSNNVLVAFENVGHFGQQLFADNINLQLNPRAIFTVDDTTVCQGGTVNFTDQSTGLVSSRNWTFTGGNPTASTQPNVSVTYVTPGQFDVSLAVSNGSGSQVNTKTGYLRVHALPVPAITAAGNILSCTVQGSSYQWYFNGTAITGSVQKTDTARRNGNYSVTVADANGCSGTSSLYPVTGIPDAVFIYPNPAAGQFIITSYTVTGSAQMKLYSATGALVLVKEIVDLSDRNPIDISSLAAGLYEIKLVTSRNTIVKKMLHFTR